jgi:hypothetical protein
LAERVAESVGPTAGDSGAGDDASADEECAPATWRESGVRPSLDADLASSGETSSERRSGIQLTSEKATLPPPSLEVEGPVVSHIHLRPSIDEILYRLSLGDEKGAFLAGLDLEPLVPRVMAPRAIVRAMHLSYLEEYVLSFVDAVSTWGEILDGSPFAAHDTLGALCELVDKGIVTVA